MTDRVDQLLKLIDLEQRRFDDDGALYHLARIGEARAEMQQVLEDNWTRNAVPAFQHHAFAAIAKTGFDAVPRTPEGLAAMSRVLRIPIRDILDAARESEQVAGVSQ